MVSIVTLSAVVKRLSDGGCKYSKRVIWQRNRKFKGEHKCETTHRDEKSIKARFVAAIDAVIDRKDNILEDCRSMQTTRTDCTGMDAEIERLLEEADVVAVHADGRMIFKFQGGTETDA